jgi:hypothetical protein
VYRETDERKIQRQVNTLRKELSISLEGLLAWCNDASNQNVTNYDSDPQEHLKCLVRMSCAQHLLQKMDIK